MHEKDDMMGGPMPGPRNPLDVSDIPTADDVLAKFEAGARKRLDDDVGRLLDAVRLQLRQGNPTSNFDAVGRGLGFVDGTIGRVNELLEPRGWRVMHAPERSGWYVLRRVGALQLQTVALRTAEDIAAALLDGVGYTRKTGGV